MLQNATPLRKSAPGPPNTPATENASLQILFKCPTPAIVFGNATKPSRFPHVWQGPQSPAPATRKHIWASKNAPYPSVFCTFDFKMCTFSTSQLPKVVRSWCALYILNSKCASRDNGVHFLNISTPKRGPNLVCFVHFDLQMCFAPQRRAIFI